MSTPIKHEVLREKILASKAELLRFDSIESVHAYTMYIEEVEKAKRISVTNYTKDALDALDALDELDALCSVFPSASKLQLAFLRWFNETQRVRVEGKTAEGFDMDNRKSVVTVKIQHSIVLVKGRSGQVYWIIASDLPRFLEIYLNIIRTLTCVEVIDGKYITCMYDLTEKALWFEYRFLTQDELESDC